MAVQYEYTVQPKVAGQAVGKAWVGSFSTPRDGAQSFRFAFSSCAYSGSNSRVFKSVEHQNPLMFIHMGDLFYGDVDVNDPSWYQREIDRTFSASRQKDLFGNVPMAYMW